MSDAPDWEDISRRLRSPFDPKDVDFMPKGKVSEQTGKAQVVAYCDARAVQDRLDAVVGAGDWAFDWEPVVVERGEVQVAKGTLTIHGISKSDAGSASNFEQSLGAVSHCFKRAAVQWGIGRYLYDLAPAYVAIEKGGRIAREVIQELRAKLPRPSGTSAPPQAARPVAERPVAERPVAEHSVAEHSVAEHSVAEHSVAEAATVAPIPHQAAPLMPRERMRRLGWADDKVYLAKIAEVIGHPSPYSQGEQAKWIQYVAEQERLAAERAATPLAQLKGGARPN